MELIQALEEELEQLNLECRLEEDSSTLRVLYILQNSLTRIKERLDA